MDGDAISRFVHRHDTRQRIGIQIEKIVGMIFQRLLQGRTVFLQADDIFAHHAINRQMQLRISQPFDLIYIIGRIHHARAAVRKITRRVYLLQFRRR